MLKLPTYLAPSGIHGMGLFTPSPVKKGTLIWAFDEAVDYRVKADDLVRLPADILGMLRMYVYFVSPEELVLCGDNARFMNHSFEPNCDEDGPVTIANTDIPANTELTCDYRDLGIAPAKPSDDPAHFDVSWAEWDALVQRAKSHAEST